jgi:hypothetical protein
MGLCAISRWCEGCRNNGKPQLSSALDRISERITLAFQTLSRLESIRGPTSKNKHLPYISIGCGGESVSQSPLNDQAFSTFLDQNPPFALRPKTGVSPPIFSWNPSWLIQVLAQPFDFRRRWTAGLIGVCGPSRRRVSDAPADVWSNDRRPPHHC